jgi:polysaccharide export outer membrane protein
MRSGGFRSIATRGLLYALLALGPVALPAWAQDEDPESASDSEQVAGLQDAGTAPAEQPMEILEARPVVVPPVEEIFAAGATGYRIGRQDLLDVRVFDLEELNQTVRVSDDGSITLPLLGRLAVAGLTKGELEALIARLLEERFVRDPQVTIFVKEYESRKVAVSGAVRNPNTYEMLGDKTLLEMISLAGGLEGDLGREIIIFRAGTDGVTDRVAIDLEGLIYRADPSLNMTVRPGDIIYVPEVERVRLFVSGAVSKPGLYEVPRDEPVTVLKAVTLAGGGTDRASEKKVQILRTGANGERVTLQVNLKKIKRGKADDIVLQKDDVVLVPESYF